MKIKAIGSICAALAAAAIVATPAVAAPRHMVKKRVCKVEHRGHGAHQKRIRHCRTVWVRR